MVWVAQAPNHDDVGAVGPIPMQPISSITCMAALVPVRMILPSTPHTLR